MHTLTFRPDDVLFFRDGRPMSGSLAGHGDSIPHPHILNSALHTALHRAFGGSPDKGRTHGSLLRERNKRRNERRLEDTSERFGDLVTAGPFPVFDGVWHFPAPADLQTPSTLPSHVPLSAPLGASSLAQSLLPVVSLVPPQKGRKAAAWLSTAAYESYVNGREASMGVLTDSSALFEAEHTIGIGIDGDTGATGEGRLYSKAQLRMRAECALGALGEFKGKEDLLGDLFPQDGKILLGGETRSCHVVCSSADRTQLPCSAKVTGRRIKWILLSPALFPFLPQEGKRTEEHPGGWLPSWINPQTFEVQLLSGYGGNKARRLKLPPGQPIRARLVSALIQRALPISGWSIREDDELLYRSGARSTLLAVPAGSVYYFEADTPTDAEQLSIALSWHGVVPEAGNIVNRRSGLMGEKGFGLGVCAPWHPFERRPATS